MPARTAFYFAAASAYIGKTTALPAARRLPPQVLSSQARRLRAVLQAQRRGAAVSETSGYSLIFRITMLAPPVGRDPLQWLPRGHIPRRTLQSARYGSGHVPTAEKARPTYSATPYASFSRRTCGLLCGLRRSFLPASLKMFTIFSACGGHRRCHPAPRLRRYGERDLSGALHSHTFEHLQTAALRVFRIGIFMISRIICVTLAGFAVGDAPWTFQDVARLEAWSAAAPLPWVFRFSTFS
jgi:hypothetical protein